ncbi:DUF2065 domain-containing protein [Ralstonia mannitolilytica]|jgi:uncharacterized protein YjeT (DUF2065 family)|uniref:DUF2065 domain-containing protein n=1 Tax=Ralstonia mannitolilytica TaxID=105219 RepID=A0AAD2B0S4_9RALS|nr:DUF2065 domain-containing protein [Ralstonia mannitolilytica]ATG20173.1 DUF2065 domain-containing protein [Ralstonia pickettii]ANA34585.1 membrane protein [Ralstonia mannitolilytica]MBY4719298.1 DUF2065 domain-containing protein [Ralstonia mannitolilytica]CAJ0684096.1 hypothetical protein R82526_02342 [Ralstonia mannitolilytica]CAJ0695541.1 hypothetical protein R77591_04436 [Ralstonia mannitolilytica]
MEESLPTVLLAACALVLVFEGILPFVAPQAWRRAFQTLTELPDEKLRVVGLVSMAAGLILLRLLHR